MTHIDPFLAICSGIFLAIVVAAVLQAIDDWACKKVCREYNKK